MILLERTKSRFQLTVVYTAADVFFNPTLEDNFPTDNLEAEACGTAVITYGVGGCSETISGERSMVMETSCFNFSSLCSDPRENRKITSNMVIGNPE